MSAIVTAAPRAAIELRGVTKEFVTDWRGRRRRALDNVSLNLPQGRVTALVGPNGSGKTTLLKICAGLTEVTAGTCVVSAGAGFGGIGYVPDDLHFPGYLTARDALGRFARLFGVEPARVAPEIDDALAAVGLVGDAGRCVREFSRGMRQRLALAQALLGGPELLLLDEPAATLDPRALQSLAALIAAQRAAGRTVVLSSHFLPQVEEIADEFVLLENGRVLFTGDRPALVARGGLEKVFLEGTTG